MKQKALEYFTTGYNCAEALLKSSKIHLTNYNDEIRKTASFFGSGMYIGECCGVVTGALMALGLKYAPDNPSDRLAFKKLYKKSKQFQNEFRNMFNSLNCRELKKIHGNNCSTLVKKGAEILERIISSND